MAVVVLAATHTACGANNKPPRASLLGGIGEVDLEDRSGYLRAPAFVALLDHLHLVFDAQLEFLQTHFLKLFVV